MTFLLKLPAALLTFLILALVTAAGALLYFLPQLPSEEAIKEVRLQVPLRIYTRDGRLMGVFGEQRRIPVHLDEVPEPLRLAFLAAEDDRFYKHPGVDYQGLLRAAFKLLQTGEKRQGGSTITMQVARNFFLSSEKTFTRKIKEILLAFKLEHALDKDTIFELYLNKIYLGHRAYGVAAAAQVYYGKTLDQLTLAEMAMIAGLPKAPSRYNPITDPQRALARRAYVLERMRKLGYIDEQAFQEALRAPLTASLHDFSIEVEAPYAAEMARAFAVERFGEAAYTQGLVVYTTLDPDLQRAARKALRQALLDYDRRHGYRGPAGHAAGPGDLDRWPEVGGLVPALVTEVKGQSAVLMAKGRGPVTLPWEGMAWARPYRTPDRLGPAPKRAGDILKAGDVVYLRPKGDTWALAQPPEVEGALVALSPEDGAILALSGGFDFQRSNFNRVTQAHRQPGSNFKPFIYSAALEKGFTPASLINDAPVVIDGQVAWRPENYSGRFHGPTRLREALVHSRNLVSIRILRAIGIDYAIAYLERFGFRAKELPRGLSLALGSASVTPLEIARGYAVFANGGHLIAPYLIARIEAMDGTVLWQAEPPRVCEDCAHPAPRTITPQNAYLMTSMMKDVIRRGTGRRALVLGRRDLAGKTGTTNDQKDAWFSGFNADLVATAWVGFDTPRPLGRRETGARAALPMWIAFMKEALEGRPERSLPRPTGLVTVRIDPHTGLLAAPGQKDALFETFRVGHAPLRKASNEDHHPIPEALF